jgi:hypothetical protein
MLRSYTSIPITRQPYPTAVNFPAYLLKKRGEFAYYATRKEKKKGNDVPAKRKRKRCLAPRHVIDRYQNMGPGVFLKTARSMANYPCDGLNYTWARATMLYNENHHHQEVKMNHMGKLVELHPSFLFFLSYLHGKWEQLSMSNTSRESSTTRYRAQQTFETF